MMRFGGKAAMSCAGAALLSVALAGCTAKSPAGDPAAVAEFAVDYAGPGRRIDLPKECASAPAGPMSHVGSTHEIEPHGGNLWISGQNHDSLVRVAPAAGGAPEMARFALPAGSGPHGIAFDAAGRLWLTLEYKGCIVALEGDKIVAAYDVSLDCAACAPAARVNSHPHGLGVGSDGRTIWFTGKATGTVGRIAPDGTLAIFPLPTAGSTPIYIKAGPDRAMWVTELTGNKIARVTPEGAVTEYAIPTPYSRPIAIVPDPDGKAMWFSEEAGGNVARIGLDGTIAEFALPREHPNHILAGLAFDRDGNLWVQQYVDHSRPKPAGTDRIIRIARAGLAAPGEIKAEHLAFYPVPSRDTVMHRIVHGPDDALWFTEMNTDRLGRIAPAPAKP